MNKIIAGFPGIGKSYVVGLGKYNIVDSDSSQFSWIREGVRNPDFPNNYIEHIREQVKKSNVLVSTHKDVRKALRQNNLPFILVYPTRECKQEYLKRYELRRSQPQFLSLLNNNWDKWIDECINQSCQTHRRLFDSEYLSDIIEEIL